MIFSIEKSSAQGSVIEEWVYRYNGTDSLADVASAIDAQGCIVMVGSTQSATQGNNFIIQRYTLSGVLLYSATYNGPDNGNDVAVSVITDNNCNIIVTGYSWSASGQEDWLTLILDSVGNIISELRYAGTANGNDRPSAMVIDGNGNIFITGYSTGIGTSYDYTTIMYNSAGLQQWVMHYDGGSGLNDIAKAIVLSGSEVIITGYSTGSLTNRDFATVKYNITGTQLWVSRYTSAGNNADEATDIDVDAQGNIYVCGFNFTIIDHDYATIKYSPAGVELWVRKYNSGDQDQAFAIVVNKVTSEIYVTGWNFTLLSHDIATVKYDSTGTQLWVKKYDGPAGQEDGANDIAIDDSGYVYVCGFSKGIGTDYDYVTLKLTPNGDTAWVMRYNRSDSTSDVATDLALDKNNNVYVTGSSMGGVTIIDIITIKYSQTLPVCNLQVNLFVTDESCTGAEDGAIDLTVTNGILPYIYQWSNGAATEDISTLPAGGYFVIVTDSNGCTITGTAVVNAIPPDSATAAKLPPPCSELFISEYVEGTGQNKALEIYNPTDTTLWLNRYFLRVFMNGAPTPLIVQLNGFLAPKQTHVIANPNAGGAIQAVTNQTSNKLNFNGDDPIQFIKVKNSFIPNIDSIEGIGQNPHAIFDTLDLDTIDQIGIPGVDPGNNGYPVGSGTTKDATLIRNYSVSSGITDWGCGQKQWRIIGQDIVSNLGIHNNACKLAGTAIIYSFENPSQTIDSLGNKYFEFDLAVGANISGTFFQSAQIYIRYDTVAFGAKIATQVNNNTLTRGPAFDIPTYNEPPFVGILSDKTNNIMRVLFTTNSSIAPNFERVELTSTLIPMLHFKINILTCNTNTALNFDSTFAISSAYADSADFPFSGGIPYSVNFFKNKMEIILCELNIFSFTPQVYPGTWCEGTTDNKWLMEIQGIGFGDSIGNVFFRNTEDTAINKYVFLDSNDFLFWSDNYIKIKMPSYIDTTPFLAVPGSGLFYMKTNSGDSIMSNTPVDMPYAIHNLLYTLDTPYSKVRVDHGMYNLNDSISFRFKFGPSLSSNPVAKAIVRKAIRAWNCTAGVPCSYDGDSTVDISTTDLVSVIHFTSSLPAGKLAESSFPTGVICTDGPNVKVFFAENDIALDATPSKPWWFDTIGKPLPPDSTDFYEVILHEIGHTAMLFHVNYEDLMFYLVKKTLFPDLNRRTISTNDQDGALNVLAKGILQNSTTCITVNVDTKLHSCDTVASVKFHNNSNCDLHVFPNPATETLIIGTDCPLPHTFLLYNILGEKTMEVKLLRKEQVIYFLHLSNGIYFYQVLITENHYQYGKIIINNNYLQK
ncbi:MAG: SBBP repeat-containing protein [Bacteroidetes bacterium]|nr:SBBP repeat-containing protein [Bacteroidota bacterium]